MPPSRVRPRPPAHSLVPLRLASGGRRGVPQCSGPRRRWLPLPPPLVRLGAGLGRRHCPAGGSLPSRASSRTAHRAPRRSLLPPPGAPSRPCTGLAAGQPHPGQAAASHGCRGQRRGDAAGGRRSGRDGPADWLWLGQRLPVPPLRVGRRATLAPRLHRHRQRHRSHRPLPSAPPPPPVCVLCPPSGPSHGPPCPHPLPTSPLSAQVNPKCSSSSPTPRPDCRAFCRSGCAQQRRRCAARRGRARPPLHLRRTRTPATAKDRLGASDAVRRPVPPMRAGRLLPPPGAPSDSGGSSGGRTPPLAAVCGREQHVPWPG